MSKITLKPCPFCGSEAVLIGTEKENWVECTNKDCGCEVFLGFNDKAIKVWNTRKPVDKVLEHLEVLCDLVNINQKLAVSQAIDIVKKGMI